MLVLSLSTFIQIYHCKFVLKTMLEIELMEQ